MLHTESLHQKLTPDPGCSRDLYTFHPFFTTTSFRHSCEKANKWFSGLSLTLPLALFPYYRHKERTQLLLD